MAWTIELTRTAQKQLAKIDAANAKRIIAYLRERIAPIEDPRSTGKALNGVIGELWRYRVGDFRVICEIQDSRIAVLAVQASDRRDVYR